MAAAARQRHPLRGRINRRGSGVENQFDPVLGIEFGRAQWDPFLGRGAGEIVFRQVRAVIGRRVVGTDDRDLTTEALAAQHLGRGISCRTAADDDDPLGRLGGRPRLRRHAPLGFR